MIQGKGDHMVSFFYKQQKTFFFFRILLLDENPVNNKRVVNACQTKQLILMVEFLMQTVSEKM
jgi:hypothetical protein